MPAKALSSASDPLVDLLLHALDEAFDVSSWHGPNFRGAIRGVTAAQAAWRPGKGRHSIRELVCHVAYWKYAVRRRLLGQERGAFPLKGHNWFAREGRPDEAGWKADVALLMAEHRALRAAVAGLSAADLPVVPAEAKRPNVALIRGAAAHDLYHAGQVQLLKRLMPARR